MKGLHSRLLKRAIAVIGLVFSFGFIGYAEIMTIEATTSNGVHGYITFDTTREEYYTRKEIRKLKKPAISLENKKYTFVKEQKTDVAKNEQLLSTFKYCKYKYDNFEDFIIEDYIVEYFVISEGKGLMRMWKVSQK